MENNKNLENILMIREIRNNLESMNITNEEKEVLRRSLNYYEEELDIEIQRNSNNNKLLYEEKIKGNVEYIDVPVDGDSKRYIEFASINESLLNEIINSFYDKIDNLDLDIRKKGIILKSLRDYCDYLKQLSLERENNKKLYDEMFEDQNTK